MMTKCSCPDCGHEFDVSTAKRYEKPWHSLLKPSIWPSKFLNEELQKFNLVECPQCSHKFRCETIRFFGIFGPKSLRLFLLTFLLCFICAVLYFLYEGIKFK